ncbi:T9SS type A sorting domain-containing protein [Polaribacter sp. Asnod6-C07]|uniref:T9SS type A sorting domain-containing protein n=1 Tax=Polaribacter sp. Asnod6-C07 TaxID=3160582 RepID=UPI00386687C0
MKKTALLLLAFIGLCSFQVNAQTELTVTDVVEVQAFTVQRDGDLDSTISAITAGTGTATESGGFISILSDAVGSAEPYSSSDNVQGTFTFTVRSTGVDVTSDITLSFRKRRGNSVTGSVDLEGSEVATFSAASDGTTNQPLHDISDVVLSNVTLTTTPKTIVVNLTSLLRESQISSHSPTFRFDGVSINKTAVAGAPTATTYTTTTDGAWETPGTWVGGVVPFEATDNIIIDNTVTINSDVTINDLARSSGSVTVEPGFSITINGVADTGHQLFGNSTETSFASIMLNGSVTQAVGYNLFIDSNGNGNELISPPFIESLSRMLSQSGGDLFENTLDTTEKLFGPFNNDSGMFETWNTTDNNSTDAEPGTGYRAATTGGSTVQFKAVPATIANIEVTIDHGNHATYGQWNLIGNPYPTYLNFQEFFTANTDQFESGTNNALYMWNGAGYSVYNNASTTATSLIAPGQGFFVKTIASTTGTVTFTPAMRKIAADGTLVSKSANNNEKALAKINLTTATKTFATDIYFIQNQTRGLDVGYDAGAFAGSTDGIFTNLVEANTGEGLLIQALPYDDYNNVVVPVAINAEAGAELTISLDIASLTLPENTYVFLKDNVLNTTTLLNDVDYVFTPTTALNGTGRFFLEFSAKSVLATDEFSVNEMLIYTNQANKSIIIKGLLKTDASAKVFDIQGRMVLEQKIESSNITNVINANSLNTGVYMVQLENKIQKVIIK